jgi:hypothetical protein
LMRAPPEPLLMKAPAEVKSVPGSRILLLVAPAWRIAVTAAWTVVAQVLMLRSCWEIVSDFTLHPKVDSAYRLVHQAKGDFVVVLVLGCKLRPKTGELGVRRAALTNNGTVPSSIIVDINDAKRCS